MTEPQKMQTVQTEHNAAADPVTDAAKAVASLGGQVTALWLGVARTAVQAAAKTLSSTSEMIGTVAKSMEDLSSRIEGSPKKA